MTTQKPKLNPNYVYIDSEFSEEYFGIFVTTENQTDFSPRIMVYRSLGYDYAMQQAEVLGKHLGLKVR